MRSSSGLPASAYRPAYSRIASADIANGTTTRGTKPGHLYSLAIACMISPTSAIPASLFVITTAP
jgi:hypothetical protein